VTIPFAAASPRSWNTWGLDHGIEGRVLQKRRRARDPVQGEEERQAELEVVFKVTTYTKPGHDKKVDLRIEILAADRVLKTTAIERIDAEEKKKTRTAPATSSYRSTCSRREGTPCCACRSWWRTTRTTGEARPSADRLRLTRRWTRSVRFPA